MSSLATAALLAKCWFLPDCTDARSQPVWQTASFGSFLPICLGSTLKSEKEELGKRYLGETVCDHV